MSKKALVKLKDIFADFDESNYDKETYYIIRNIFDSLWKDLEELDFYKYVFDYTLHYLGGTSEKEYILKKAKQKYESKKNNYE